VAISWNYFDNIDVRKIRFYGGNNMGLEGIIRKKKQLLSKPSWSIFSISSIEDFVSPQIYKRSPQDGGPS